MVLPFLFSCRIVGLALLPLAATATLLLSAYLLGLQCGGALVAQLHAFEKLAQAFARVVAIQALGPLALHLHFQPCGHMPEIHATGGLVDFLPSRA
jgi:hypothetical protein